MIILIQFALKHLNEILNSKVLNKIYFSFFHKAALHLAIENENIEIINLLLENQNIDVNIKSIQNSILI